MIIIPKNKNMINGMIIGLITFRTALSKSVLKLFKIVSPSIHHFIHPNDILGIPTNEPPIGDRIVSLCFSPSL